LALWAKVAENGGEKGECFCNGYNEVLFFFETFFFGTGQINMKFGKKRQSVCFYES